MSRFNIPNSLGQVRQVNRGDIFGELWATLNIDLTSSPGKLKTAKKLGSTLSSSKMNDDDVQALALYNGYYYNILSSGRYQYLQAARNPRISGTWVSTDTAIGWGNSSDAVVFDGKLLASTSTNIAANSNAGTPSWDDDWWTSIAGGSALTTGKPHIMDVSRIGNETLFITDGNLVRYMNITAGPVYNKSTVTLAEQLTACCLATDYAATWVGTYSSDGNAYVYEIYIGETDEFGTPVARNAYKVDGTAVLSMDVVDGVVYIVTDRGHIQVFNGRAFVTVGSFPFAFDSVTIDGISLGDIEDTNIDRGIHPKGMRAYGKSLYINVNTNNELIVDLASNPTDDDDIFNNVVVNERSPSGVWEFDTETGVLNHRYTLEGYHRQISSGPILVVDNQYTRILTAGRVITGRTEVYAENPDATPFGYFITREIDSDTVQDAWEKLALKTEALESGESIEVKYRTSKNREYPAYAEGTWLNTSTFNTTDDLSMVEVGDEIEMIDGTNAGRLAHVTEINQSGTVYSVVLDTAIGTTGETDYARFQNWKKIDVTIDDTTGMFKITGTADSGTYTQFKVVLNGNIEVRGLMNKGTAKTEM